MATTEDVRKALIDYFREQAGWVQVLAREADKLNNDNGIASREVAESQRCVESIGAVVLHIMQLPGDDLESFRTNAQLFEGKKFIPPGGREGTSHGAAAHCGYHEPIESPKAWFDAWLEMVENEFTKE